MVALPYGDVDADALQATGLSDVLTRSLPGTPAGTAQDPPSSGGGAAAETSAPAGGTGTTAPEPERSEIGAGAEILAEALDVEPRTDLAWAAGGSLRSDTLATLQAGGVRAVVLGTGGLTEGDAAVGLTGTTAAARATVRRRPTGPLGVLVADPTLGDVVGAAEQVLGGPRMAEQRYLAELAVIGLQAPAGTEQTVLVAPPRDVEAGPEGAGAMMADTTALPWLRAGHPGRAGRGPGRGGGARSGTRPTSIHLDPAGLAAVAESVAVRDDLAGAVAGDADIALRSYDAAVARHGRGLADRSRGLPRRRAAPSRSTMDRLRGQVTLLAPADGTYSLASSDAPLVLTVRNDLPVAVEVRLEVRTRGNRGLSISDIGSRPSPRGADDPAGAHRGPPVRRVRGDRAADHPGGGPLGDEIQLQVKSTAYGPISLLITIGAAALLGLLFLRRLVNFVLRRRRAAREQAGSAACRRAPPCRCPRTGARCDAATGRRRPVEPPARRPARAGGPAAAPVAVPGGPAAVGAVRHAPPHPARRRPRCRPRPGRRSLPPLPPVPPPAPRNRWVPAADDTQVMTSLPPVPRGPVGESDEEVEPREGAPGASGGILRAAGTMAVATLVSRITGLLRTMVLAAALGVGLVNDAYNTANTLPNIVYELLLGGVLASVVVPLLVHAQERDGDGGTAYAQRLATIATAGLVVVTALAIAGRAAAHLAVRHHRRPRPGPAGQLAGAHPAGRDRLLRSRRARPGDPQLPRRLRAAGLGAGAQQRRRHRHRRAVHRRERAGRPRAGDDLAGPGLAARHRHHARHRRPGAGPAAAAAPGRRAAAARAGGCENTGLREAGTLGLWVIGYVGGQPDRRRRRHPDRQRGRAGGRPRARAPSPIASLLFQMPYGIIGVALLTALVPRMSRAASRHDIPGVAEDLALGTRLSALGLLPVTAALVVLGPPLALVVFARGNTSAERGRGHRDRAGGRRVRPAADGGHPAAAAGLLRHEGRPHAHAHPGRAWSPSACRCCCSCPSSSSPSTWWPGSCWPRASPTWPAGSSGTSRCAAGWARCGPGRRSARSLRIAAVSVVAGGAGWLVRNVTDDLFGASTAGSLAAVLVGTVVIGGVALAGLAVARVPELREPLAAVRARMGRG